MVTLSAEGQEDQTGEQYVEGVLGDPAYQAVANDLGVPLHLSVEGVGTIRTWLPEDTEFGRLMHRNGHGVIDC